MAYTVADILAWTGGRWVNEADLGPRAGELICVRRPAPLGISQSGDIAFFFSRAFESELATAGPGICITGEAFVGPLSKSGLPLWKKSAVIACADPYWAMAVISERVAFEVSTVAHAVNRTRDLKGGASEVHPTAIVHSSASLGPAVRIGAHCVVEAGARIGAGSQLYPGCFIGPEAMIGEDCVLFPSVTIYEWVQIGDRARIHAGARIGADGFGYAPIRCDKAVVGHKKIYHLGRVVIGDDVEIGANSCVDRGTIGETRVEKNAKLDNVVHVGHNAHVGEGAVLCGGVCLAGNASVGKYAYVGGMSGVSNHVHVGDAAQVGAMTLVTKDVEPGGTAVGNPQRDHAEHFRAHAALNRLLKKPRRPTP